MPIPASFCQLQTFKSVFFSSNGIASSDFRQRLNPTNLEEQLYLKTNKRFWDIGTVNDILSQADKETN